MACRNIFIHINERSNSAGLYCAHLRGENGASPHVDDSVKMTHCWQARRKCQARGHHRSNTMSQKGHLEQIKSSPELVKSAFAIVVTLFHWLTVYIASQHTYNKGGNGFHKLYLWIKK